MSVEKVMSEIQKLLKSRISDAGCSGRVVPVFPTRSSKATVTTHSTKDESCQSTTLPKLYFLAFQLVLANSKPCLMVIKPINTSKHTNKHKRHLEDRNYTIKT